MGVCVQSVCLTAAATNRKHNTLLRPPTLANTTDWREKKGASRYIIGTDEEFLFGVGTPPLFFLAMWRFCFLSKALERLLFLYLFILFRVFFMLLFGIIVNNIPFKEVHRWMEYIFNCNLQTLLWSQRNDRRVAFGSGGEHTYTLIQEKVPIHLSEWSRGYQVSYVFTPPVFNFLNSMVKSTWKY